MSTTPALAVSGLDKSFSGVHAVNDVSFEIAPGETLSIIGPNGSGKSTFIKILAGYYEADAGGGTITVGGGTTPVDVSDQRAFQNTPEWTANASVTWSEDLAGGTIAFTPLAQGLLTNKYLRGIPEDSRAAREGTGIADQLTDDNIARIRALEGTVGLTLLDRGPRGARLTAAGALVVDNS